VREETDVAAPLVSVVTIFYDAERFLGEAAASVLAQRYRRWELILVDDGSTDGSSAIALGLARRHPGRVRYLEHPGHANRGMSASRNLGVRAARGAYVAFLDADDVWLPEKLGRQVAALEAHASAGMACGTALYWSSWTGRATDRDVLVPLGAPPGLHEPPALLRLLYPLGPGTAPCPSDLLIRRDAIERVGGFEAHFQGPNQMYEDQAFLAKLYLADPVLVLDDCLLKYRQHPDSCVSAVTRAGQYHAVRQYFLRWYEGYLAQRGLQWSEAWDLAQRALWPYRHPLLARLAAAPGRARRLAATRGRKLRRALARATGVT
jgi:glycosyltransferase involved in cell wall biosynthesis